MAELEEKLNAILGNQEAMGQIMALAHSLSAGSKDGEGEAASEERATMDRGISEDRETPDLSALLGQIDPDMIQLGMRLLQEYRSKDDRNAALLQALHPFVKEERRAKLDQALQIARITHLVRVALETMGKRGEEGDV